MFGSLLDCTILIADCNLEDIQIKVTHSTASLIAIHRAVTGFLNLNLLSSSRSVHRDCEQVRFKVLEEPLRRVYRSKGIDIQSQVMQLALQLLTFKFQ